MKKTSKNNVPLSTKITLHLERHGTNAIGTIIKKDKDTRHIHSVFDIPYSSDKTDKSRFFDWHCPHYIADSLFYSPTPVLFYIHGGSWSTADKSFFSALCKDFAEQGIIVININYRLMPENKFEDAYHDCVDAIKFCLKNSEMFGIDNSQVFIGGDSAGAHLSSLIAAKATSGHLALDCKIAGLFLFYGVYDLNNLGKVNFRTCRALHNHFKKLYTDPADLQKFYRLYSPINFLTDKFPPCFVTAGKIDHLTKSETLVFLDKLTQLNVEHSALIFPKYRLDARHAFINLTLQSRKQALMRAFKFLHSKIDKTKPLQTLLKGN